MTTTAWAAIAAIVAAIIATALTTNTECMNAITQTLETCT